jgi:uncharacterized protein YndB with AHSA1/START domain
MKALKIIGGVIISLLVIAVFLPTDLGLSRSITINQSPELVFEHVHNFNHYMKWNPWSAKEATAEFKISDDGSRYDWIGTEQGIGIGHLEHETNTPYTAIVNHMVFESPMEAEAKDVWQFEKDGDGTRVTWSFQSEMPYPSNLFRFMAKSDLETGLAADFEAGLKSLKAMAESYVSEVDSTMNTEMPEGTTDSKE